MMLYTKYESSGPCSFGQEDFWKLHFENLFFDPMILMQPTGTVWTTLIGGPPRDHSCEVWPKSNKWFQRRCLKKLLTDARTDGRTHARTDDGWQTPDIEGSQKLTEHFVLSWAKKELKTPLFFSYVHVSSRFWGVLTHCEDRWHM